MIGTRRHDEWRGLGSDARIGERFEALRLTEFSHDVVHQTLLDLPREFGGDERWEHAETLHRLSEGLPALLARSVKWADDTRFRQMERADDPAVFDAVARAYIENDLLAADSLLPLGGPRQGEALVVLREMLRLLSPYRLFTQSHLKFHVEPRADPAAGAGRRPLDAGRPLGGVGADRARHPAGRAGDLARDRAPVAQAALSPPLPQRRRPDHRARSGEGVLRRVDPDRAAGREQQVVLVESLWHEASRLVVEQPERCSAFCPKSRSSCRARSAAPRCTSPRNSATPSCAGSTTTTSSRCCSLDTRACSRRS